MTLARRALLAFCIALATAVTVATLIAIDASGQPHAIDKLHRN